MRPINIVIFLVFLGLSAVFCYFLLYGAPFFGGIAQVEKTNRLVVIQTFVTAATAILVPLLTALLTRSTGTHIEKVKADLTKDNTEVVKRIEAKISELIPRRHDAYHKMYAAISSYYWALQQYESGKFVRGDIERAEESCEQASGVGLLMEDEIEQLFNELHQEANFLRESGFEVKNQAESLKDIWQREGKQFGQKFVALKKAFRDALTKG